MFPKRIRILLVDDWDSIRLAIGSWFIDDPDFEIIGEACDGRQAITRCEALQPDVVVMDIVMPRMDGIMATKEIRQRFPHICVIILTMSVEYELTQAALNAGAYKVIIKGYDLPPLRNAMQSHAS